MYETYEVKTDCFGYNPKKKNCSALKSLYCKKQPECPFYKTVEQMCNKCDETASGRVIACKDCIDIFHTNIKA